MVQSTLPSQSGTASSRFQEVFDHIAAGAINREQNRILAYDAVEELRQSGFTALRIPAELGGQNVSLQETFRLLVKLAAADSNLPQIIRAHFAFVEGERQHLTAAATRPSAIKWLETIQAGAVFGAAMAELGNATETTTTLTHKDGKWYLNGTKYYSTGSIYADWIAVVALHDDKRYRVAVPTTAAGVTRVDDWDGFGQRLTGSGTTLFENVELSEEQIYHILPKDDSPIDRFFTAFYQNFHLATLAGIAQAALRETIEFVRPRTRVFGVPGQSLPREDPLVQAVVGRLSSLAFAAETLVDRVSATLEQASRLREQGLPDTVSQQAELEAFKAQQVIIPLVLEATTSLFEVGGASASSEKRRLDRFWRNARVLASHNPAIKRARELGDWELNGTPLDSSWTTKAKADAQATPHLASV